MENGGATLLLSARAFNPEDVQPGSFDFAAFPLQNESRLEPTDKNLKKGKLGKGKEGGETPGVSAGVSVSLPTRVSIDAMSITVGWRLMGTQTGQVKLFVDRFPKDFSLQALGKVVLPMKGGKPYVTKDGKLPCPLLSTFNAVKVLTRNGFKELEEWCGNGAADAAAVADMRRLVDGGSQVEWKEFPSYTSYMLSIESASAQADVSLKPHLADTAMLYVQFCMSQEGAAILVSSKQTRAVDGMPALEGAPAADTFNACLSRSCKPLDDAFLSHMQGSNKHRFGDAMRFLRRTDMAALVRLVQWRKKAHYLHANAMSQYYFACPEWSALQGKQLLFETPMLAQVVVLNQALKKVSASQITLKDTPKLVRSEISMDLWLLLCKVRGSRIHGFQTPNVWHSCVD